MSGRSINYDCSGPVNAYVLTVRAKQYGPQSYFDGMKVEFTPNITNTGASTVDVNGLGVISITDTSTGGELEAGTAVRLRYNASTAEFEIIFRAVGGIAVTTNLQNGGTIDQTFETINWRSSAFPAGPQGNITYGVTIGTAEVFALVHNGPDTPKWEFRSALAGDALTVECPSAGNAELSVLGEIYSGTNGDIPVPNQSAYVSSDTGSEWYQDIPSYVGGVAETTRMLSFVLISVPVGQTIFNYPFGS